MVSFWPNSGSAASPASTSATASNVASSSKTTLDPVAPTSGLDAPLSQPLLPAPSFEPAVGSKITIRSVVEQSSDILSTILSNPVGAGIAGITTTSLCAVLWWRYFRRIPNAEYVTPAVLRYRKVLVGRVVTVGDADGFRFHHTPGPPFLRELLWPWPPRSQHRKKTGGKTRLVRETISVRIAGVDAPESAHFGKPAQPYSKEAKEFLTGMVQSPSSKDNLTPPTKFSFYPTSSSASSSSSTTTSASSGEISNKLVWLYPSHIDQYKRLVATPYVWEAPYIFGKTNVSLAMVKQGLATVYRAAGADYGKATWWAKVWSKSTSGLKALERAEAKAKKGKVGMWKLGNKFESPEDYKRRVRGEA